MSKLFISFVNENCFVAGSRDWWCGRGFGDDSPTVPAVLVCIHTHKVEFPVGQNMDAHWLDFGRNFV